MLLAFLARSTLASASTTIDQTNSKNVLRAQDAVPTFDTDAPIISDFDVNRYSIIAIVIFIVYLAMWLLVLYVVWLVTVKEATVIKREVAEMREEHRRKLYKNDIPRAQHHQEEIISAPPSAATLHHSSSVSRLSSISLKKLGVSSKQKPSESTSAIFPLKLMDGPSVKYDYDPDNILIIPDTPITSAYYQDLSDGIIPTDSSCNPDSTSTPNQPKSVSSNPASSVRVKERASVIFVASGSDTSESSNPPSLLLTSTLRPRHAHLYTRFFKTNHLKITSISTSDTPTTSKRFVSPQLPHDPTSARVHHLIHAAIRADLAEIETVINRRITSSALPTAALSCVGFVLLSLFILIYSASMHSWGVPGLGAFMTLASLLLGVLTVLLSLIRDLLIELKAEREVLLLSTKRLRDRAPYTLDLISGREEVQMNGGDWALTVLVGLWALVVAVVVDPEWWRATISSEEEGEMFKEKRLFFVTGKLHPAVWVSLFWIYFCVNMYFNLPYILAY